MVENPLSLVPKSIAPSGPKESLLVLSDVHLGSDLNEQARATGVGRRSKSVDHDLVMLLRHYRQTKPTGARWRIVIAGDFIDFIGMSIPSSGEELSTEPSAEELEHGLGNSSDHALIKLRKVADRHREVFAALASFVAEGHALTIVHGNHDLEFHWDIVKEEFRKQLHRSVEPGLTITEHELSSRIEFNPWFFYVNGVAYIEHGHQYDRFCATDHIMSPLSPLDPRRAARGFCDILLRFVVRPTKGLKEYGHEHLGIVDYLAFGVNLGLGGMIKLGMRYGSAVRELLRVRRGYFSEATKALKAEHDRRIAILGEKTRLGIDRLRAVMALQSPPITRTISGILASLLLDKLALGALCLLALLVVGLFGLRYGHVWYGAIVIAAVWGLVHWYLGSKRKIDPADELVERAGRLAKLFPAAFVVMGHTHIPVKVAVNEGQIEGQATYINLGSWAEEEEALVPDAQAARTHLVIHPGESGAVAEFLKWDSTAGPRAFVAG